MFFLVENDEHLAICPYQRSRCTFGDIPLSAFKAHQEKALAQKHKKMCKRIANLNVFIFGAKLPKSESNLAGVKLKKNHEKYPCGSTFLFDHIHRESIGEQQVIEKLSMW